MIDEVRPQLPALEHVVYIGTSSWDDLRNRASAVGADLIHARSAELSFDDPINIQYTSGTTGFPKGATLSHHNILNNGYFTAEGCRYTDRDRVCVPVPLYHCFGMVMGNLGCTTHGATIVYPAESFDPLATLCRRSAARASTGCRRCSSPSSPTRSSVPSICPRCGQGSWRGRRVRWR
jgi:fatty-acyl-CoA synthase